MFVSVACELGSEDHRGDLYNLLKQYGFTAVLEGVFESVSLKPPALARLKRDIDRNTDSYDIVRVYQYPIEGTLVISSLEGKRWRKIVVQP